MDIFAIIFYIENYPYTLPFISIPFIRFFHQVKQWGSLYCMHKNSGTLWSVIMRTADQCIPADLTKPRHGNRRLLYFTAKVYIVKHTVVTVHCLTCKTDSYCCVISPFFMWIDSKQAMQGRTPRYLRDLAVQWEHISYHWEIRLTLFKFHSRHPSQNRLISVHADLNNA